MLFLIIVSFLLISCSRNSVDVQSKVEDGPVNLTEAKNDIKENKDDAEINAVLAEEGPVKSESLTGSPQFDIPIIINEKVNYFINYFQTVRTDIFRKWLSRSEKYIPMMKKILKEKRLPEDMVYLALIESGFSTPAYSRARASGPWQFIKSTGKRYGLRVNEWVDERRDPEKSTIAAAEYLQDLYDMFGHWYLAAAAYNAGEGKVLRAMQRSGSNDYWEMINTRYLKRETRDYVPKMIAAALIAKEPEKYGFVDIDYSENINYEKITLAGTYDLRVISDVCNIPYGVMKELNPELKTNFTPPYEMKYLLKVPPENKDLCQTAVIQIPASERYTFTVHKIRRGDTLSTLAVKYGSTVALIKDANGIKNSRGLRIGKNIIIPVVGRIKKTKSLEMDKDGITRVTYIVKKNDTLWEIAREHNVLIHDLKRWNNLDGNPIKPGDRLIIVLKNR